MSGPQHLPPWLRTDYRFTPEVRGLKRMLRTRGLHTVCEEAKCPNIGECFSQRTATFMVLGDTCTRRCTFCGCKKGIPTPLDEAEPKNVALAAQELGLRHCVVTSVTRDDLADGGASHFAETIEAIRELGIGMTVEVLTPDFRGDESALETVLSAKPDVLNMNVETVPRLYPDVRPGADYRVTLELLCLAKRIDPCIIAKSGLMVGLGETSIEVEAVLSDLAGADVDAVTIGQYMRPSKRNVEVARYYEPDEFLELKRLGEALGIRHILAGPLVRSSYRACELTEEIRQDNSGRRI